MDERVEIIKTELDLGYGPEVYNEEQARVILAALEAAGYCCDPP